MTEGIHLLFENGKKKKNHIKGRNLPTIPLVLVNKCQSQAFTCPVRSDKLSQRTKEIK